MSVIPLCSETCPLPTFFLLSFFYPLLFFCWTGVARKGDHASQAVPLKRPSAFAGAVFCLRLKRRDLTCVFPLRIFPLFGLSVLLVFGRSDLTRCGSQPSRSRLALRGTTPTWAVHLARVSLLVPCLSLNIFSLITRLSTYLSRDTHTLFRHLLTEREGDRKGVSRASYRSVLSELNQVSAALSPP